ncbi:MAG: ABC transporter ATP-binding protein [Chloroflexota bacterium]|nr:ABC transporter ATP-binding protein [Chloroflexota bacterium]
MADIRVENLRKAFGPVVALDDVSFSFADSEVTCLLGPSGCGKTTLMRIVAGLERPTAGEVFFGDRRVTALPPRQREIGMVFQYPVVYRGISVYRNIELPLLSEKLAKAERARRVEEVIDLLGLGSSADKDVSQLDNGTRQKVAVAREVARQPRIILFDEPITNVDAVAKLQLKRAFKELTRRLSQTIVYVTHDQTEAMTLADRIALMRDGRIVQYDAPRALYNRPADRFGGWFLGNPGMAFFDAELRESAHGEVALASPLFPEPVAVVGVPPGAAKVVTLGIRPEQIHVAPSPTPGAVPATLVRKSITIGRQYLLTLRPAGLGERGFKAKVEPALGDALAVGGEVWVTLPPDRVTLFDPAGQRLAASLAAPDGVAATPQTRALRR